MVNSSRNLILDGDGVVLDFSTGYVNFLREVHGIDATLCPTFGTEPSFFNFKDLYPTLEKPWFGISDFINSYDHFSQINAYDSAKNALVEIKASGAFDRIIMLTSCGNSEHVINARMDCLSRQIPNVFDEVLFVGLGGSKHEYLGNLKDTYGASVFVDDLEQHCLEAQNHGHFPLLFHRRYNANLPEKTGIGRIKCLSELLVK